MKADIGRHKLSIAKNAETELPHLMVNFETGDLNTLGALCNAIKCPR